MGKRAKILVVTAMVIGCCSCIERLPANEPSSIVDQKAMTDPFADYKSDAPSSQRRAPAQVTKFAEEDEAISNYLLTAKNPRDRAIMAGMQWIVRFIDDDYHLNPNFQFMVLLLHELSVTNNAEQARVATSALRVVLAHGLMHVKQLFSATEKDRWQFISLLRVVERFSEFSSHYHRAYRELYGTKSALSYASNMSLDEAIERNEYVVMGDYVLYESFLYEYLLMNPTHSLVLPKSNFLDVIANLEKFSYGDHTPGSIAYINLAYLATHVVFALSNYGERPIENSVVRQRAEQFIDRTYESTLRMGYLDLFAEYVQCVKIMRPKDPRIVSGESLLLSLQRENGSWGRERDFASDVYHAFHPTWAVLTALNQLNRVHATYLPRYLR